MIQQYKLHPFINAHTYVCSAFFNLNYVCFKYVYHTSKFDRSHVESAIALIVLRGISICNILLKCTHQHKSTAKNN